MPPAEDPRLAAVERLKKAVAPWPLTRIDEVARAVPPKSRPLVEVKSNDVVAVCSLVKKTDDPERVEVLRKASADHPNLDVIILAKDAHFLLAAAGA